jgi:1,2-diacylglycerol 3-alpha-glucosyltransferase
MLPAVKARVPDVLLVIAGEGPAAPGLKRKAAQLGLTGNVLFVGYLARSGALQDCYQAGDAFVFASRTETQGLVLLEAMALGVPVVSTAVMGTAEVLDDGRGCVVAQEQVDDFAAKTTGLLLDAELRRRLGDEARAYAAHWSAPALAQRLCGFYQRVLGRLGHEAADSATDPAR